MGTEGTSLRAPVGALPARVCPCKSVPLHLSLAAFPAACSHSDAHSHTLGCAASSLLVQGRFPAPLAPP